MEYNADSNRAIVQHCSSTMFRGKKPKPKTNQSLEVASFIRSFLRILPDGFLGIEAMNATFRILLYGATCALEA